MKKKIGAAFICTCFVGSCLGITACKSSKEDVFEAVFKAMYAPNSTVEMTLENTYEREEAEDYGKWESNRALVKTDAEANLRMVTLYEEYWTESMGETKATFTVENYTAYYFEHKEKYYLATNYFDKTVEENPWTVTAMEKAEFLETINEPFLVESELDYEIGVIKSMDSLMNWNRDLKGYELSLGTSSTFIKILEDKGMEMIEEDILYNAKVTITDIGTTEITLPNDLVVATDKYIQEA